MQHMRTTWIIGYGNIGQRVSHILSNQHVPTNAICRTKNRFNGFKSHDIKITIADLDKASTLKTLNFDQAEIFYFAPPPPSGDSDKRMTNFLASLNTNAPPRRIVYISTTGVYGDYDGQWITEQTPTKPGNDRSIRRLSAENQLKAYCSEHDCQYIILRVPGIYDQYKLPLNRIRKGVKVLKRDIAPASNRIHAADLANICIAAMTSDHCNKTYNVADGNPSSISDYFIQTAQLFDLPPPEEIDWQQAQTDISPEMLSYLTESKKIDPALMLRELKISLLYPDLKTGLAACKRQYESKQMNNE